MLLSVKIDQDCCGVLLLHPESACRPAVSLLVEQIGDQS